MNVSGHVCLEKKLLAADSLHTRKKVVSDYKLSTFFINK